MASLNCQVVSDQSLDTLYRTIPQFRQLRAPHIGCGIRWHRGNDRYSEDLQVVVMGKTGYGKSTLLNRLVGREVFATSDTASCTRTMQSAEFSFPGNSGEHYFSLADLPGIGENPTLDREYVELYQKALTQTNLVLYVLRADQRDFSSDLWAFNQLFSSPQKRRKLVIVLNAVDKVEPLSRTVPFRPNQQQLKNLSLKQDVISQILEVDKNQIISVSGAEGYGVTDLVQAMMTSLGPFMQQ